MQSYEHKLSIKSWAEEDRPREKLLLKGRHALSDAELLAILIGSGSREETAVALSQRLLADFGNDLNRLGRLSIQELMHYKGIGEAKAISIVAALELGRRRKDKEPEKRPKISSSKDVFELMNGTLADLPHEEFHALYLNRANRVMSSERISTGGVTGTVADSRLILKSAINLLASGLVVCHNHPSGNLQPSAADKKLTKKLQEACRLLDIQLLDHLIITDTAYFSFADEGML